MESQISLIQRRVNPIPVDGHTVLFDCTTAGRFSDSVTAPIVDWCLMLFFDRIHPFEAMVLISLRTRNVPKFSDRQVWANIVDPDQTQGQQCLPFHLHRLDAFLYETSLWVNF